MLAGAVSAANTTVGSLRQPPPGSRLAGRTPDDHDRRAAEPRHAAQATRRNQRRTRPVAGCRISSQLAGHRLADTPVRRPAIGGPSAPACDRSDRLRAPFTAPPANPAMIKKAGTTGPGSGIMPTGPTGADGAGVIGWA
ncbi:hypothetical protein GCM10010400_29170 [Streptomyces aculeolatus]